LKAFKREQRFSRRVYRRELWVNFDEEVQAGREGQDADFYPSFGEVEQEAWENYEFDALVIFDEDLISQLAKFRSSLHVIPPPQGGYTPTQVAAREARTSALWAGYRRVYFGELEAETSDDQVMDRLRTEIADLEERAARAQSSQRSGDPPSSLPFHRDDDELPPPNSSLSTGTLDPGNARRESVRGSTTNDACNEGSNGKPNETASDSLALVCSLNVSYLPLVNGSSFSSSLPRKLVLLSQRVLRRVLSAKESIFKFGTFVPKNDRQADSSPEAPRWKAGRDLEWLRLGLQGTFDGEWTWDKVHSAFPSYRRSDIGFLFYVYDFKFSGEHRVRLVFDGSRQSASTFSETYAPTVRAESVRLFHIACVEEGYVIGQYDVPQAFLKADIDHDIFAFPPRGQAAFSGQILKLRRALYGGKQSAYLWFQMMNQFLLELGFHASPLDACFYRRSDALLILYCDDLRIGATSDVLSSLHAALLARFDVTTAPGSRFLGMDTSYAL
jgi:hypothetical protein